MPVGMWWELGEVLSAWSCLMKEKASYQLSGWRRFGNFDKRREGMKKKPSSEKWKDKKYRTAREHWVPLRLVVMHFKWQKSGRFQEFFQLYSVVQGKGKGGQRVSFLQNSAGDRGKESINGKTNITENVLSAAIKLLDAAGVQMWEQEIWLTRVMGEGRLHVESNAWNINN